MFPGEEYVTLAAALAVAASGGYGLARGWGLHCLAWAAGGLAFTLVALLLAIRGFEALESPLAPVVGSLYPALLASSLLIALRPRLGLAFMGVALALIIVIAVSQIEGLEALGGAAHGVLHTASGLTLIAAPIVALRMGAGRGSLLVSVGGLLVSVGGFSLAALKMGVEVLPMDVIVWILHPLLALSALLMAAGFIYSRGLSLEPRI